MTLERLLGLARKSHFDLNTSALSDKHDAYRLLRNRLESVTTSRSDALKKYVEEDIKIILSTDARVEASTDKSERDTNSENKFTPSSNNI